MDEHFFIEETHKLKNNFYNGDKSLQLFYQPLKKRLPNITTNKISSNRTLAQLVEPVVVNNDTTTMNSPLIDRLRSLCEIKSLVDAVETLIEATRKGCCFLEKYIAILLNYCSQQDQDYNDKLLGKLMEIDFDKNQLTENLRRPEFKADNVVHIINLLRRVQQMLDHHESKAVDWLNVIIDAYFVELATSNDAMVIIDQIMSRIDLSCAFQKEVEITKSLLKPLTETMNKDKPSKPGVEQRYKITSYYMIEELVF